MLCDRSPLVLSSFQPNSPTLRHLRARKPVDLSISMEAEAGEAVPEENAETLEDLRRKVSAMIECVDLVREAVKKFDSANPVAIGQIRLSIDPNDSRQSLLSTEELLLRMFKDLANHVLIHFKIANFSFLLPENDSEINTMKVITSSLLRLCESHASSSSGGVVDAPSSGVVHAADVVRANGVVFLVTPSAGAPPALLAVRDVEESGVFGWIKGRARKFTTSLDSVMLLIVLCAVGFTYGKAFSVLCFSFVLFTLMAREFKRI